MKLVLQFSVVCALLMSCKGNDNDDIVVLPRLEQFALDTQIIDDFIAENQIQNVQIESKGIRYVIHEEGTGNNPVTSDSIKVNFEGRLLRGETFDDGEGDKLLLNSLIAGWQIGVPLIKEGGNITLYIPSFYAWGTRGSGDNIPPNANVVFNIDLIEIVN